MSQAYEDLQQNRSNKYLDFIKECREKARTYTKEQLDACYQHHIVPRHHYKNYKLDWDTFDLPENLVTVTHEDHVKAHEVRFEVYNELADKVAYTSMTGSAEKFRAFQQAGGQAANRIFREEKRQMFDPEFQREMARRSIERPDARAIRSEGGKKGNRVRHQNVTVRKEDRYTWNFRAQPFLCTFGFDNGGDLLKELYKAQPTKLARVTPLIKGEKRSLHGWSYEKIEPDKANEQSTNFTQSSETPSSGESG